MARHAAHDSGPVDPLVAAALAHRPPEPGGAHRVPQPGPGQGSAEGWPAPPPSGGGRVGWPGPVPPSGEATLAEPPTEVDLPEVEPAPTARRGWRRLFGRAA